jgi:organic radical activating enzyme
MLTTLCSIPWTWLEVNLSNSKIRSCCKTDWISDNNQDLFLHPVIIQRRQDFLDGKRPESCNQCWTIEDRGHTSYRQHTKLNQYLQTTDLDLDVDVPKTLSINIGNLCNLACVYCNEEYSTVWSVEKHIPILDNLHLEFENKFINWLGSIVTNDHLQHIILIGGEPTIAPSFYKILELIDNLVKVRKTKLKVTIQTNGMFNKNQLLKMIDLSKQPNAIFSYRFSIESVGQQAELIRTGLKWNVFQDNFKSMLEHSKSQSNFDVTVHPTVNILCLEGFEDFLRWLDSFDKESWDHFGWNHLEWPSEFSLLTLGRYSRELWSCPTNFKNIQLIKYSLQIKQYLGSFDTVPSQEQLNHIKKSLDLHCSRAKLTPNVVPKLQKLLDKYINIGDT